MMRTDRKRRYYAWQMTQLYRRSAARNQGDDKQDEEYDEQDSGDFQRQTCNKAEPQNPRDEGDD
jgi:hypothetical protein